MFEIERKVKSREAFVLVQNLIVYQNNLIVILKGENWLVKMHNQSLT